MIIRRSKRAGFTLVELLIVIAIIGLLIQLILPAVEMAREAARRTQCQSNLRQVALGCQLHESTHRHLPSGGWGWFWTGDAERGFGPEQPGGWVYNILPYIEQESLRASAHGSNPKELETALQNVVATPLPLLTCPSRRLPRAYPYTHGIKFPTLGTPEKCARSDYAANLGALASPPSLRGPDSYGEASDWTDGQDEKSAWGPASRLNGIVYQRSQVEYRQITDGLSVTAMVGEKYIRQPDYKTGDYLGDSEHMYIGYDNDVLRSMHKRHLPARDSEKNHLWRFGSAHPNGFNLALCDGSVHTVSYDVEATVYEAWGERSDGKVAHLDE